MEHYLIVLLATSALFMALILHLAANQKIVTKITGVFVVIVGVSGLMIYSYGYAMSIDNKALAIIRSLLAVCGMFVGKMDYSAVSSTPFFQNEWAEVYFYFSHFLALYATASAAITSLGGDALQKLRLWLVRRGDLSIIYGITPQTVDFGRELMNETKTTVLFVDDAPSKDLIGAIVKNGGTVRADSSALQANRRFLRAVGLRPGNRRVTLYALHPDSVENLPYAKALLQTLEEEGIHPRQTSLVIPAAEDAAVSALQVTKSHYGYGYVTCFRLPDLAARLLTNLYPPCNTLHFDRLGRSCENFDTLLIGFGQTGQAVLRQLVMNGQFIGSKFRADVFAPDCLTDCGYFDHSFRQVLSHYDIRFHDHNAFSPAFYRFIMEEGRHLNYVVVAAGSDKTNREITENLSMFFHQMQITLPIYICGNNGVTCCNPDGTFSKPFKLYQPQVISTSRLDLMAMVLNHYYQGDTTRSPQEHWMECDYFSRMSCRASADFVPAMLRAAGKTAQQVIDGDWTLSPALLENLAHMEHLRWNAFHFCSGFSPMTDSEYDRRAEEYLQQAAANGSPTIRIAKNMSLRTHACLIDWDALDALSAKESAITGKPVDYKQPDRENVLAIPELLRSSKD